MNKKQIKGIVGAVVVTVSGISGIIAASHFFYKKAFSRTQKAFLGKDKTLQDADGDVCWKEARAWLENQSYETTEITSFDDLKLHGYYLESFYPSKKFVLLAHGYSSEGRGMAAFARLYHEKLGFNALMPDNRGHGESEGHYIGFGWHDRKDYLSWIDYLIKTYGEDIEIVLHGVSMGGGVVLMTSGEELPEQVKCIISDCAYDSVEKLMSYQLKRLYKLPYFPFMPITSFILKLRAGYSFKDANALKQVKKAKLPILFIHGGDDQFVPTEMVTRLHDAANCEKELLVIQEAGHANSYWKDMEQYTRRVIAFVKKYTSKDPVNESI